MAAALLWLTHAAQPVAAATTGTIAGTVTTLSTNAAIPGIAVVVNYVNGGDFAGKATTDLAGRFEVRDLAPGDYGLSFDDPADGFVAGFYAAGSFSPIGHDATGITVTAGSTAHVDMALPRGVRITGTVTSGGYPQQRVDVGYCDPTAPTDASTWPMDCDDAVAHYGLPSTETDAAGRFALLAIPGRYALAVGYLGIAKGYFGPGGLVGRQTDATILDATVQGVEDVSIVLPEALLGPQVRGHVAAPAGVDLSGLVVDVCHVVGGCNSSEVLSDGRFDVVVFDGPGDYYVEFRDTRGRIPTGWLGPEGLTFNAAQRINLKVGRNGLTGVNVTIPSLVSQPITPPATDAAPTSDTPGTTDAWPLPLLLGLTAAIVVATRGRQRRLARRV